MNYTKKITIPKLVNPNENEKSKLNSVNKLIRNKENVMNINTLNKENLYQKLMHKISSLNKPESLSYRRIFH